MSTHSAVLGTKDEAWDVVDHRRFRVGPRLYVYTVATASIFEVNAFLWGCLESAPYETAFCVGVPATVDDPHTLTWSGELCARHGLPGNEQCAFNLSVVPAYCSSRG